MFTADLFRIMDVAKTGTFKLEDLNQFLEHFMRETELQQDYQKLTGVASYERLIEESGIKQVKKLNQDVLRKFLNQVLEILVGWYKDRCK